jgi:predicted nucleotidyltransferase
MVEVPNKILDNINKFINELKKSNITIEQAILFGSYAHGTNHEWSDIDLAIISSDFSGYRYIDYDRFINAIRLSDSAIEPIAYRPEDFTSDNLFVKEILEHGIRII